MKLWYIPPRMGRNEADAVRSARRKGKNTDYDKRRVKRKKAITFNFVKNHA